MPLIKRRKMKRVTDIDEHVGRKLKLRRITLGLSQQKLGELVGVTFQQQQKYEKGVNRISCGKLYKLAKVLKCSVQYFFDGINEETEKSNEEFDNIDYRSLGKDILILSRILNEVKNKEKRRNLIEAIKSLIRSLK